MAKAKKLDKPALQNWWNADNASPVPGWNAVRDACMRVRTPLIVVDLGEEPGVANSGNIAIAATAKSAGTKFPFKAYVPPLDPRNLGDPLFQKDFGLEYAYVADAMANGITSVEMVEAAGRSGMLGVFGAAGLMPEKVEDAIHRLNQSLAGKPFGSNLIHSPNDSELEKTIVDLYLKYQVRLITASAYMRLTPPLVYYRLKGVYRDPSGNIIIPNKILGKVSRVEVAKQFMAPPPPKIVAKLAEGGLLTIEEAALADCIPMADAITAEADSGGHTDNRPAISLLPTMLALRNQMAGEHSYARPIFVGLGGGIATPESTAAAFALGAAYVVTGSVNQACVESGASETVRLMLAEAEQADVTMAPAADMFQMGVKVQVLKRGTMFPVRAAKLYELYQRYDSFEQIPEADRTKIEKDFLRCTFNEEWQNTRNFFQKRDPGQITRAEAEPKHKMALVFRSYLGRTSRWAVSGEPTRKIDYQIWCGPAMGAFNTWAKGSFLEKPENRRFECVAMNLLLGASILTRMNSLRNQGVPLPSGMDCVNPMTMDEIKSLMAE